MSEIERLISRHLDGELTPAEQLRFHKLLAESPDARALLREMTVLGRAARRTPALHQPGRRMEDRLFARLHTEGYRPGASSVPGASVAIKAGVADVVYTRLRQVALVAAMLIAVIGGGYLLDDHVTMRTGLAEKRSAVNPTAMPGLPGNEALATASSAGIQSPAAGRAREAVTGNAGTGHRSMRHNASATPLAPSYAEQYPVFARFMSTQDTSTSSSHSDVSVDGEPARALPVVPVFPDASLHVSGSGGGQQWMASIRGGVASVGSSDQRAQELNMRIAMQVDGGHQIALLVGSGPAVAETRHENTGIGMSIPAPPGDLPSGRVMPRDVPLPLPEYELSLRSEAWFGLGYNYSIDVTDNFSIEPGIRAGVGSTTWRMGLELPLRYRMNERMSMECALSATRVQPRDATPDRFTQLNESDHFIYEGSMLQPSFNSIALQVGVRVDLAGNR